MTPPTYLDTGPHGRIVLPPRHIGPLASRIAAIARNARGWFGLFCIIVLVALLGAVGAVLALAWATYLWGGVFRLLF